MIISGDYYIMRVGVMSVAKTCDFDQIRTKVYEHTLECDKQHVCHNSTRIVMSHWYD